MSDSPNSPEVSNAEAKNANASDATAANKSDRLEINVPRLLDLGCGVIAKAIMQAPKERSKSLFKQLKNGEKLYMGDITVQEKIKLKLHVQLDHREFVGPGFNNDVFRASVDQLLKKIAPRLRAKQDLKIRTNKSGGVLFDLPAGIRVRDQLNVMLMIMQLGTPGEVDLVLTYFNPEQFSVKED